MDLEELKETYKNLSTQELLDISIYKEGYTDVAIKAAMQELNERGVTDADMVAHKERLIERVKSFVSRNIKDDLHFFEKNFFYFFCHPLLHGAYKRNLRDDGYVLKVRQANYYSWSGFIFLMVAVVVSVEFDLSGLSLFISWMFLFLPVALFDEIVNRRRQIKKLIRLYGDPNGESPMTGDIIFRWQKEGVKLNGPATKEQFTVCEQKLNFLFPDDFKAFYARVNGFMDWRIDSRMLALWSLELMQGEQDGEDEFIAFADYNINSVRIGYLKGKEGIFRSYDRAFICTTFEEFLSLWEQGIEANI